MVYLAFGVGVPEIMAILAVVIVLFGAKKLPELARAMGSSINQFKKGLAEEEKAEEEKVLAAEEERKRLTENSADDSDAAAQAPRDEPAVVVEKEESKSK